jgi:hypothetical protein
MGAPPRPVTAEDSTSSDDEEVLDLTSPPVNLAPKVGIPLDMIPVLELDNEINVRPSTTVSRHGSERPAASQPPVGIPPSTAAGDVLKALILNKIGQEGDGWLSLARTPVANPNAQPAYRHFQRWGAANHLLKVVGLFDNGTIEFEDHSIRTSDVIGWLNYAQSTWGHNDGRFRRIQLAYVEIKAEAQDTSDRRLALNVLQYFSESKNARDDPPELIKDLTIPKLFEYIHRALPNQRAVDEGRRKERSEAQKRAKTRSGASIIAQ